MNGAVEGKLAMIRDTHMALDEAASTRQAPLIEAAPAMLNAVEDVGLRFASDCKDQFIPCYQRDSPNGLQSSKSAGASNDARSHSDKPETWRATATAAASGDGHGPL